MNLNFLIDAGFTANGNLYTKLMRAEDLPYLNENVVAVEDDIHGTTEISVEVNLETREVTYYAPEVERLLDGPYSIDNTDGLHALREAGVVFSNPIEVSPVPSERTVAEVFSTDNVMNITENDSPYIRVVEKSDGTYAVITDGVERHAPCSAEDVIRALCHYLQSQVSENLKSKV